MSTGAVCDSSAPRKRTGPSDARPSGAGGAIRPKRDPAGVALQVTKVVNSAFDVGAGCESDRFFSSQRAGVNTELCRTSILDTTGQALKDSFEFADEQDWFGTSVLSEYRGSQPA